MLIYVCGPMRGIADFNFPAFDAAAVALRAEGHDVVNPAELDRRAGLDETTPPEKVCVKTAMLRDLPALLGCDAVYALPGWEGSTGASVEMTLARAVNIPIFDYETRQPIEADAAARFAEAARSVRHPSSRALLGVLADAAALHVKKGQDYGSDADPFANVRASEDFGIPGWIGCVMRANDKMRRLQSFARKGTLANESALDSITDNVVYFAIAAVLYREAGEGR